MPKLWSDTIQAHRDEVRDAVLDTAAALITEGGLLSVTMSGIAEQAGIGRATLYKYFADVGTIVEAWHERQVAAHLEHVLAIRDREVDPAKRLRAVLGAYAQMRHEARGHADAVFAGHLHRGAHAAHAETQLRAVVGAAVADAAGHGAIRDDIATDELTAYCVHAVGAAADLSSKAAVRRLVTVTWAGLQPASR